MTYPNLGRGLDNYIFLDIECYVSVCICLCFNLYIYKKPSARSGANCLKCDTTLKAHV